MADEVSYGNEKQGTVRRDRINKQTRETFPKSWTQSLECLLMIRKSGILTNLIKSNLARYGNLLEFVVTDGWLDYLYKRMNLVARCVTTSRPTVTKALWLEVQATFLYNICVVVQKYNIPNELIINVDQPPAKYVTTGNITMGRKNSKHVPKHGANDKRVITGYIGCDVKR